MITCQGGFKSIWTLVREDLKVYDHLSRKIEKYMNTCQGRFKEYMNTCQETLNSIWTLVKEDLKVYEHLSRKI